MRKSPCCGSKIWALPARRRQCSNCKSRWRVRSKKRGRRERRNDERLIAHVLSRRRSLTDLAQHARLSRQAISARFRKVLARHAAAATNQRAHTGEAILLVDGLWFRFKRRPWVLYLTALRPVQEDRATFLDPVLLEGVESKEAWIKVIGMIPKDRRESIRAIVGDKFSGCRDIARINGWILQLCHFHLLAQFKGRITLRSTTKARVLRQEVYKLVSKALLTIDSAKLGSIRFCLKALLAEANTPKRYKSVVRGFLRTIDDYHAYLIHPELRLPRTNGTSEAMARRVRDLLYGTRSISSPTALTNWATSLVRLKPTIMCRPGPQQPN
jgi:hypothetical protein